MKKSLEAKEPSAKNEQPIRVEPMDEIVLEKPNEKEVSESVVNYVGEYVYDTKLQNDDIHQKVWKILKSNFHEGVEEFLEGSTCNEKI